MEMGINKRGFSFGASREESKSMSYIPIGRLKTPAPVEYQRSVEKVQSDKGFSMRPRTAYERTCKPSS